jgi:hypothetical protein
MNRFFSIILSLGSELLFYFRPSNRKGFISFIFIIGANSIPVIGVIFLNWNPFMILFIYWGESLIIGIFNLLKMFISGSIENGHFSPSGFAGAAGLCAFFTVHYGLFMFVHGIFLVVFMILSLSMSIEGGGGDIDPFSFISSIYPGEMTAAELLESEFSAVIALFLSHLVSFYLYFIKPGEYNHTTADVYMMRPYKRIFIMHLTIIFGAFALFISGFKSAVFIIIWIGLKILFDLKIHVSELKKSPSLPQ